MQNEPGPLAHVVAAVAVGTATGLALTRLVGLKTGVVSAAHEAFDAPVAAWLARQVRL